MPNFNSERSKNIAGDVELVNHFLSSFVSTRKSFADICNSDRTGLWLPKKCIEGIKSTPKKDGTIYQKIIKRIANNQEYVHKVMTKNNLDALLLPITRIGYSAPGYDHFNTFNASLASNAGLPGIGFVMGYSKEKHLPIGIQLIGKANSDAQLVGYVHRLQPLLLKHIPPTQRSSDTKSYTIDSMNNAINELGQASLSIMRKNSGKIPVDEFYKASQAVLNKH